MQKLSDWKLIQLLTCYSHAINYYKQLHRPNWDCGGWLPETFWSYHYWQPAPRWRPHWWLAKPDNPANAPHIMLLLPAPLITKSYSPEHEEFHACASILIPLTNWLQTLLVVYLVKLRLTSFILKQIPKMKETFNYWRREAFIHCTNFKLHRNETRALGYLHVRGPSWSSPISSCSLPLVTSFLHYHLSLLSYELKQPLPESFPPWQDEDPIWRFTHT